MCSPRELNNLVGVLVRMSCLMSLNISSTGQQFPGGGCSLSHLTPPANGETFRGTCFLNNVSATMFPRLRGPLEVKLADFGLT